MGRGAGRLGSGRTRWAGAGGGSTAGGKRGPGGSWAPKRDFQARPPTDSGQCPGTGPPGRGGDTAGSDQNQGLKGFVDACSLGGAKRPALPQEATAQGPPLGVGRTHCGSPRQAHTLHAEHARRYSTRHPFPVAINGRHELGQKVELLFHPALAPQGGPDHWVVSVDGEDLLFLKLQVYLKLKIGKRASPVSVRQSAVRVRDGPGGKCSLLI